MSESIENITLIKYVKEAFSWRKYKICFTDSNQLSADEMESVLFISKLHWEDTSSDMWERCFDVISWLSPLAFCYYLPGIMISAIKDNEPDLIVVISIISMLDRSPNPDYWDEFFIKRWTLLTPDECSVVQRWIFWLSSFTTSMNSDSLIRALETLDLLIKFYDKSHS